MKNKGFVLMETIIVIVVISVALLTIFSSYNKILRKTKSENKYDTSEYIYMTDFVKKHLSADICKGEISVFSMDSTSGTPQNYYTKDYLNNSCDFSSSNPFNIKGIYFLNSLTNVQDEALEKFNANMIDYIRKLDVGVNDTLIIVEYKRPAKNWNGDAKTDSNGTQLNETYIASLEW